MIFRVRLYCRDCTGQDSLGCFDGGTEILCERKHAWSVRTFTSQLEAKDAGYRATNDAGPWEFEVLDEDDTVVWDSGAVA